MRRVRYHTHGGPEVLAIEETGFRSLTGEVVGIVEDVGPDADPTLTGTRVAALLEDAYADYVVADTNWLVTVPKALDPGAASMLPTVGAVALGALRTGRLSKDDTVLVTAGAGAIGHLAVQLAKRQGAGTVIATAGSTAKLDFLTQLGADATIDHTRPDWAAQVQAAAPSGIDLALEAVGGDMLHTSIDLLAPLGRVVAYGAASGDLTAVPVTSLFKLKTVAGFSLLAWRATDADQARADITELTDLFQTGDLHAAADTRLPLADAAQAHRLLEHRAVVGRLLLVP